MNFAQKLSGIAARYRDKPAVVFEGAVYTYDALDREVSRYAAMLDHIGVRVGDRIAIQLPKRMEFVFLELAVLSVGAVALPLNTDYRPEEVHYFLSDSGSRFFFTDRERFLRAEEILSALPELRTLLVDASNAKSCGSMAHELENADRNFQRTYPTRGDDVAVICYTSGTTGRSKGAMITHKNMISNTTALHLAWEWSDRDVLLHVLPLFHVHGLFVALHGALNAGATVIMHEKFDARRAWETIDMGVCTILMGVPTMYQRLMNEWDELDRKPNLQNMRVFISGSAPLLDAQFRRFEQQTGFRILERYGMTETGMNTSNTIDPAGRKGQSVGYPLPGVEIRVCSPDGKDVPPGDVGEVWVRGDNVFKGYWKMPGKTKESFHGDWFMTGDLGYQDHEDGKRLYLVGRAKELIITGGYNVYPKEIENVLQTHEAVKEAAVIGIPDEDFGERVVAVVVAGKDMPGVSSESLIRFCKDQLAGYKCPKQIFFVDELPRNAMGKLQKNLLAERYRESAKTQLPMRQI
ncbi:MAG: AMP-binding protein [Desulfomonile sp.]|nr:AMP-binding protein [Desulfomonile sp.]